MICSSSPSPSPVRLSPVCVTVPSGLLRLLKNTKWLSESTLPSAPHRIALASRSKSAPVVVQTSQPRPTTTEVRLATPFVSETLPPLARLTPIELPLPPPRAPCASCRLNENRSVEVPVEGSAPAQLPVAADERVGRAVVLEGLVGTGELG